MPWMEDRTGLLLLGQDIRKSSRMWCARSCRCAVAESRHTRWAALPGVARQRLGLDAQPPTQVCTQSSRARATHPALDVERGAKPTGVGRDITAPANCRDEVSESCRFCSGLVQHCDISVAQDDAVTRRPHHKAHVGVLVAIADNEALAIGAQTQRGAVQQSEEGR